jgi:hypothetical protein
MTSAEKTDRPARAGRSYKKDERGIVEAPALRSPVRFGLEPSWVPSGSTIMGAMALMASVEKEGV